MNNYKLLFWSTLVFLLSLTAIALGKCIPEILGLRGDGVIFYVVLLAVICALAIVIMLVQTMLILNSTGSTKGSMYLGIAFILVITFVGGIAARYMSLCHC